MIEEMTKEEIDHRLDEIEDEISKFNKAHTDLTHLIEGFSLPSSENECVTCNMEDFLHNLQYKLQPLLDAIQDLEGERGNLTEELDDREEAEHIRQERHGKEQL